MTDDKEIQEALSKAEELEKKGDCTEASEQTKVEKTEPEDASTLCSLGLLYYNGEGVDKSLEKAAKLFSQSAEMGNAEAQYHLGWMYDNGKGVVQSDTEAVEWYRKAAEQGNEDAIEALFNLLLRDD